MKIIILAEKLINMNILEIYKNNNIIIKIENKKIDKKYLNEYYKIKNSLNKF